MIPILISLGLIGSVLAAGTGDRLLRHASSVTQTENVSNLERVNRWMAGWEMFRAHPTIGIGYDAFGAAYPAYRRKAIVTEHRAQVGYVVHEPFRGRGFATRAVEALVERLEAIPSISRIWATCALDNPASTRVLEKCGFQREGILKNWVVYPALGDRAADNYSYVRVPPTMGRIAPV